MCLQKQITLCLSHTMENSYIYVRCTCTSESASASNNIILIFLVNRDPNDDNGISASPARHTVIYRLSACVRSKLPFRSTCNLQFNLNLYSSFARLLARFIFNVAVIFSFVAPPTSSRYINIYFISFFFWLIFSHWVSHNSAAVSPVSVRTWFIAWLGYKIFTDTKILYNITYKYIRVSWSRIIKSEGTRLDSPSRIFLSFSRTLLLTISSLLRSRILDLSRFQNFEKI